MDSITSPTATITLPNRFKLQSVDEKLTSKPTGRAAQALRGTPSTTSTLGVLSNFSGTFIGNGFNTIWRPSSGTQKFENPVPLDGSTTPAPNPPNEGILELNLTTEELAFTKDLGNVPNRGRGGQKDIILGGVSYIQVVRDVTNINTGKADGKPQEIHFEPGLWIRVPATNNDAESLARMGSIPHGTTINAQCLAPTTTTPGAGPNVDDRVDITPFPIGRPKARLVGFFPAMTVNNKNTARLPQDLDIFSNEGTITQEILNNPNLVLVNANKGKNILNTISFKVSTAPSFASASDSDGISNIAFLEGRSVGSTAGSATGLNAPKNAPKNADAALMTAQFWISTVQHEIEVPKFQLGEPPLRIAAPAPNPGAAVPVFVVNPPHEITEPKKVLVTSTQIQYSQVVNLDFFKLTWPHVSVATLVPAGDLPVPDSAFA